MTPQEFVAKWSASELKERSASQSHFNDLKKCTLTNLYNACQAWLDHIHKELDAAVAYGLGDYTTRYARRRNPRTPVQANDHRASRPPV